MRKIFSLLSVFVLTIIFFTSFSSQASAAVASKSYTQTLKYGNYQNTMSYNGSERWKFAQMYLITNFQVNQNGLSINEVRQTVETFWPYQVTKEGKKIQTKTSSGSNQTAKAYGDFHLTYITKVIGYETDYRLQTTMKVTKIDRVKKTVTVQITQTVN
ncbi:hypothetical protein [Bacillus wiedmannii]|uniref:hypothetical protein n=1 Tax=Bacillus wiedmannii TaxID=1890302 RepID=UPI003D995186